MMKVNTIPGASYALTCTAACTVKAVCKEDSSPVTILEADKAGQYVFVAPTDAVEVSDEHALVTQTFKGAALGLAARGGIQPGEDAVLKNMTAESATFAGTVNANAGVNIPMATGAPTDMASVNRAYALGMAQGVAMHQARTYWLTDSCTATNGVTINHVAPGCYCESLLAAETRSSFVLPTTGAIGAANYSKMLGYSIPMQFSGGSPGYVIKLSMLIGGDAQFQEDAEADIDGFRFRPVAGVLPATARLLDVTLYCNNGYCARVRELVGVGTPKSYVVRTTVSHMEYDGNTNPLSSGYRLVIAQSHLSYTDALAAGVWLIMGGASTDTVIKLADIRGWDSYHMGAAPILYLDTRAGEYGALVRLESPTVLYGIGDNTYVRYGLEPYQRSWITTETEVPYTEDQPVE